MIFGSIVGPDYYGFPYDQVPSGVYDISMSWHDSPHQIIITPRTFREISPTIGVLRIRVRSQASCCSSPWCRGWSKVATRPYRHRSSQFGNVVSTNNTTGRFRDRDGGIYIHIRPYRSSNRKQNGQAIWLKSARQGGQHNIAGHFRDEGYGIHIRLANRPYLPQKNAPAEITTNNSRGQITTNSTLPWLPYTGN